MYKDILKNNDNLNKKIHGVFTMNIKELLDGAIRSEGQKQEGTMCDIYCIHVPGCGCERGKNGDMHILNRE